MSTVTIINVGEQRTTIVQRGARTVLTVSRGVTVVRAPQGIPGPQGPPGSAILTTVGDLLGYNGANARFPVGTDDQILIADSGEAFGFRWDDQPEALPPATALGQMLISVDGLTLTVQDIAVSDLGEIAVDDNGIIGVVG